MARDGRRVLGQGNPFTLTAGAIEHTCPEPQRWQIRAPKAGTHDPLTVTFDEPLDPAMLVSALKVKPEVAGAVELPLMRAVGAFTPATEWRQGAGVLEIDPLLEDLAGNNLLGPFEVDRDAPAKAAKTTTVGFEIQ